MSLIIWLTNKILPNTFSFLLYFCIEAWHGLLKSSLFRSSIRCKVSEASLNTSNEFCICILQKFKNIANSFVYIQAGSFQHFSFLSSRWNGNNTISSAGVAEYSQGKGGGGGGGGAFLRLQYKQEPICKQNFLFLFKIACVHAVSLNTSVTYLRTSEEDRWW